MRHALPTELKSTRSCPCRLPPRTRTTLSSSPRKNRGCGRARDGLDRFPDDEACATPVAQMVVGLPAWWGAFFSVAGSLPSEDHDSGQLRGHWQHYVAVLWAAICLYSPGFGCLRMQARCVCTASRCRGVVAHAAERRQSTIRTGDTFPSQPPGEAAIKTVQAPHQWRISPAQEMHGDTLAAYMAASASEVCNVE